MTTNTHAAITDIESAATARWLAKTLAPARNRNRQGPSAEAVDRIRARVFGEQTAKKRQRSIAA